jgi:Zn-dependent protease
MSEAAAQILRQDSRSLVSKQIWGFVAAALSACAPVPYKHERRRIIRKANEWRKSTIIIACFAGAYFQISSRNSVGRVSIAMMLAGAGLNLKFGALMTGWSNWSVERANAGWGQFSHSKTLRLLRSKSVGSVTGY